VKIYHEISKLQQALRDHRNNSFSIGLVPTMGALHAGHTALIEACHTDCNITVASVFVNPSQFNNPEDLLNYPSSLENDLDMLEENGCDIVFVPDKAEMYPNGNQLTINLGLYDKKLEGKYRPGHFSGVAQVVIKLFNIIKPDKAYFGQKDLQQFKIIKMINEHLFFNIQLTMVSTVREDSGLAMSSRNRKLSLSQYKQAVVFAQSLLHAGQLLGGGMQINDVKVKFFEMIGQSEELRIEYFEIVDANNLEPIEHVNDGDPVALCAACFCGNVRLIDNIIINSKE